MKKSVLIILLITSILVSCNREPVLQDFKVNKLAVVLDEKGETTVNITSGNGKYKIESENEEVATAILKDATISIEAHKAGRTNIIVSDEVSKQFATIAVTVNKLIIPVTGVKVSPEMLTVTDTTPFKLEVTVLPEDATNREVRFESNNFDVAVVDETGLVTPTGSGQVVISVFTKDGEKEAICKLTVELPLPDGVVIEDGLLRAWPNEAIPDNGRVVIPEYVTEIRKYTFKNADRLRKIVLPAGLQKIGTGAFQFCVNLEEITIPGNVEMAGSSTFMGCTNMKKAILEEGVVKIFGGFFQDCTNLVEVSLPSTLEKITPQAFSGCENLPSITIPKGIIEISDRAFMSCHKLAKIEVDTENAVYSSIEGVLYSVDKTKLYRCPSGYDVTSYIIPSSTTYIGNNAFDTMSKMTELTIPESVKTIGENAFYNINNAGVLKLIHCKSTTPPVVEGGWFSGLGFEGVVKVPSGSVDAYKAANGWKDCTIEAE